jgi:hypothetical protein
MIDENGRNDCNRKKDEIDEKLHCDVLLNELGQVDKDIA